MENAENASVTRPAGRSGRDRRRRQTHPFSMASLRGSRKTIRRAEDRGVHFYVDLYAPEEGLLFISILLLSVADAFLTLELISRGMSEYNAVMDYYLQRGPLPFILTKYLLTAVGLVCLLLHKNYPLFRGWLSVRTILIAIAIMYAALIGYELLLLSPPCYS